LIHSYRYAVDRMVHLQPAAPADNNMLIFDLCRAFLLDFRVPLRRPTSLLCIQFIRSLHKKEYVPLPACMHATEEDK
jgi:hypothetical protein